MPSYIAAHPAAPSDELLPLVVLADDLLVQSRHDGVTIRNVAIVPRAGHLYVRADAPAPTAIADLLHTRRLAPVTVVEADDMAWARLVWYRQRDSNP